MRLFPEENQQPVLGGHRFSEEKWKGRGAPGFQGQGVGAGMSGVRLAGGREGRCLGETG